MNLRICLLICLVGTTGAQHAYSQGHAGRGFFAGSQGLVDAALPLGAATVIPVTGLAPTYEASNIVALTQTPDDQLYAIVSHPVEADHLYLINPETGAATFLAEMGLKGLGWPSDLELDDLGFLWASINGNLYQVDPSTGAVNLLVDAVNDLEGIAYHDGSLYTVRSVLLPGGQVTEHTLMEVDRTSGALSPVAELSGVTLNVGVDGLDFDEVGNLWMLNNWTTGLILPVVGVELARFPDAASGVAMGYDLSQTYRAFTVARGSLVLVPTDIPTLDTVGISLLILMIMTIGWVMLRRSYAGSTLIS